MTSAASEIAPSVRISMVRIDRRETESGAQVFATFNFELPNAGVKVTGCVLVRRGDAWRTWLPISASRFGRVEFSVELLEQVTRAALDRCNDRPALRRMIEVFNDRGASKV